MPKSPYYNQSTHQPEKDLLMGMSQEVINLHGINVQWIHNPYTHVDKLYREDRLPDLGLSKTLVVLPEDGNGPVGDAIFSKFGFTNTQQLTLEISVKEWKDVMGTHRPLEGDIVYTPFQDEYGPADFWKVTFIDRDDPTGWFPLGKHHVFSVTLEKWAYSSEDFDQTGVAEIDSQLPDWTNDISINPSIVDPAEVNTETQRVAEQFIAFDEKNPFGEVQRPMPM